MLFENLKKNSLFIKGLAQSYIHYFEINFTVTIAWNTRESGDMNREDAQKSTMTSLGQLTTHSKATVEKTNY